VRVRLTRRLANHIDGVDVSTRRVGDRFDVTRHDGDLLIAEGWAVQIGPPEPQEQRRAEDVVRDRLHDEHARILNPR